MGALHLSAVMHPEELYFQTMRFRRLVEPENEKKSCYFFLSAQAIFTHLSNYM